MKKIIILIIILSIQSIVFGQNYTIVEKKLTNKLNFDSLQSKGKECLISIFYKDGGLGNDCDKSEIINSKENNCDLALFKNKLINELNNCSFLEKTTIQIFRYPRGAIHYLKDEDFNKTYIEDVMAFVSNYGGEIYTTHQTSNFFLELNKKTKYLDLSENPKKNVTSIFEFSPEIHKKSVDIPFKCPNHIQVLNRKKQDLISGNSCPTNLFIPVEDIFIKHLTLLFKPNYVLNQHVTYNKKRIDELERKNDSLNNLLESKITKLKNLFSEGSIELNAQHGLINSNSIKGDLESLKTSVSSFNNIELSFIKQLNRNIDLHASVGVFNSQGNFTMTNSTDNWNDDIGAEHPLMRTIEINDFEESWQINNGITIKLGFKHTLKLVNDKLFISGGGNFGLVFPFFMKSNLEKGVFNYRGRIKNIEGELTNVNALGLYENVSYPSISSQKNQFSGYVIDLNTSATYTISNSIYSKLFIQYSLYQLNNKDYNPDSRMSLNYGEFSSSMFQMSSLNLSIFSVGIGIGIKF